MIRSGLIFVLMFFAAHAFAGASTEIGSIELDADGQPITVYGSPEEANDLCLTKGKRLPTAREYAEYAMSKGAIGIAETEYRGISIQDQRVVDERKLKEHRGYVTITKTSEGVTSVDFYYDKFGFEGSADQYTQWSVVPTLDEKLRRLAFDEYDGFLGDDGRDMAYLKVRCIK